MKELIKENIISNLNIEFYKLYSELSKNTIKRIFYAHGRSTMTGRITSWHKGGGNKNLFREVNFLNKKSNLNSWCIRRRY
jgi:ribosomal protein L2